MGGFAAILGAMPSSMIVAGVLCPLLLLGVVAGILVHLSSYGPEQC